MDIFDQCHKVNDLLNAGNDHDARNELIMMLEQLRVDGLEYSPLVNRLVRDVGLFPYLQPETASWQERFVYEAFKADIGEDESVTLHREQSRLLHGLLAGKSIAVSAPTSFGKSFVIDSFISIRQPSNVVILVPTIALADETRRRLHRKFSRQFKIITTADQPLAAKNILIFPQERAIGYIPLLESIDVLIVDEFYKASRAFDKERSPSLIRAIVELSKIAKQRYFLAPNISELKGNAFTEGMEFLRLDFNTVFLEKTDLYQAIGRDKEQKNRVLLRLLAENQGKVLIYAGTYANISAIANLLMTALKPLGRPLLDQFRSWLSKNYEPNWALPNLVVNGVGIHNGRLHRSLSQIQIHLFEDPEGLDRIVSTSSIIEGVNTSAEIVVLWSNKNGRARIDDFTYKNIIGRGGRMFRHFVGKVFVLEEPPDEAQTQLELEMPDELLGPMDGTGLNIELNADQVAAIESFRTEMQKLIGTAGFNEMQTAGQLQNSNAPLILKIAGELRRDASSWSGLGNLNSQDPNRWDHYLYKLLNLQPGIWGIEYRKYVAFVKILSKNWRASIPELLVDLNAYDIGIDQFFELERNTTFRLSSLLGDVQIIHNKMNPESPIDVSLSISKLSHAFLPVSVFQLEEYGLPRMLSRKIHEAEILDFEKESLSVHDSIAALRDIGFDSLRKQVGELDDFDIYILEYFYEGIETEEKI